MLAAMTDHPSVGERSGSSPLAAESSAAREDREIVADLVRKARLDRAWFELLYLRHVDAVYRFCLRRVGSPDHAADLTSQIFIKVFTSLESCDEWRFRSWLFSIARNTLIDAQRRHRDDVPLDDLIDIQSGEPSPEATYLEKEQRLSVVHLLSLLTNDQRQIVELRLAGLNGNEIAEILGRSRASVDTAQSRAIARLRKAIPSDRSVWTEGSHATDR